jgi:hypothetical protein
MIRTTTIVLIFSAGLVTTAGAGLPTAFYDFEDTPLVIRESSLDLESDGQGLSFQMSNSFGLSVRGHGAGDPAGWGGRSLDLSFRPGESFLMSFEPGVTGVAFEYGSTGPRVVTLRWEIFGTADGTGPAAFDGLLTLDSQVNAGGLPADFLFSYLAPTTALGSIRFTNFAGGTADMGIDNISVFIPAPASIGMLGVAGVVACRRRRSA